MEFPNIFKGDYRLLAVPPLLLLILAFFFIPQIKLGVDFKGGILVSLNLDEKIDAATLKERFEAAGLSADTRVFDTPVGYKAEIELPQSEAILKAEKLKKEFERLLPEVTALEIESQNDENKRAEYERKMTEVWGVADQMFAIAGVKHTKDEIKSVNEVDRLFTVAYKKVYTDYQDSIITIIKRNVKYSSISIQTVSPALSNHFIDTAINVAIASAILSALFVFIFFRAAAPSAAVIIGAACDVIIALGAMGLFGIQLTLPSFAALLMLVGFSLDTDILLTMRMLKRAGDPREKAHDAMKTGLTMSVMAIVAFATLFVLAYLTHLTTYYEISSVALAGLFGDMFATWGINAVLLLMYIEKKGG
ncbi:MAG: hypothetical protein QXT45_00725 [Candidatus Bilamarchaeaceae archaeon]